MRAALPKRGYARTGPLDQMLAVGGLDLLLLDSSVPASRTAGWKTSRLHGSTRARASTKRPALLFLHHPPFLAGIWHMDLQNLHNADALAAIVRKHPRVRLIGGGHVHRATLTRFAGVPTTIARRPIMSSRSISTVAVAAVFKVSRRRCICTSASGRRRGGDAHGADRRFRRAASVLRTGREAVVGWLARALT